MFAASITRHQLFEKWVQVKNEGKEEEVQRELENYIQQETNYSGQSVKDELIKFLKCFERRWRLCYRNKSRFISKNQTWLTGLVAFRRDCSRRGGGPKKSFEECGIRSQQQKVQSLVATVSTSKLSIATQLSLRKCGKRNAAEIVQSVTTGGTPTRAKKYKRGLQLQNKDGVKRLTPDAALALIINTKSSKNTYLTYRDTAKKC